MKVQRGWITCPRSQSYLVIELRLKQDLTGQRELIIFSQTCPRHTLLSQLAATPDIVIQGASLFSHSNPVHPRSLQNMSNIGPVLTTSAAATLIAHLHFRWLLQLCSCFTFAPYCLLSALQPEWSLWNINQVLLLRALSGFLFFLFRVNKCQNPHSGGQGSDLIRSLFPFRPHFLLFFCYLLRARNVDLPAFPPWQQAGSHHRAFAQAFPPAATPAVCMGNFLTFFQSQRRCHLCSETNHEYPVYHGSLPADPLHSGLYFFGHNMSLSNMLYNLLTVLIIYHLASAAKT